MPLTKTLSRNDNGTKLKEDSHAVLLPDSSRCQPFAAAELVEFVDVASAAASSGTTA